MSDTHVKSVEVTSVDNGNWQFSSKDDQKVSLDGKHINHFYIKYKLSSDVKKQYDFLGGSDWLIIDSETNDKINVKADDRTDSTATVKFKNIPKDLGSGANVSFQLVVEDVDGNQIISQDPRIKIIRT